MPIVRTRIKVSEGSSTFIDTTLTQAVDEYSKEHVEYAASGTEQDLTPRNIDTVQHLFIKSRNQTSSGTILFAASGTAITLNAGLKAVLLLTQTSEAVVIGTGSGGSSLEVSSGGT